jgi:phospholipase C
LLVRGLAAAPRRVRPVNSGGRLSWAIACLLAACTAPAGAMAAHGPVVFKHIIIVVQENRTPDNLFGSKPAFEPGVDIATSGVTSRGRTVKLTPEPLNGCYDISHSHTAFETALTEGADKVLLAPLPGCTPPSHPQFKYVDNRTGTVQPYFDIATAYGFANRMFQTNQGPSFPAHQFLFTGTSQPSARSPLFVSENPLLQKQGAGCVAPANQTVALIDGTGDETSNAPIYPCLNHATMADLLDGAGLSWRYYGSSADGIWMAPNAIDHVCGAKPKGSRLVCRGPAWENGNVVAKNPAQVLTDIQSCDLAAVSWVTPTAADSDHAANNQGTGPQWVASIVNAVGEQAACPGGEIYWPDTVILITWDDWGGWYDHVAPFEVATQGSGAGAWGDGYTFGFRVPLLVVSAYTPKQTVDNGTHDFGSLLYFIERNFGLGFIGPGNVYGSYADQQAAARGDSLDGFFTRHQPKLFRPIATTVDPRYFQRRKLSGAPVDEE